MDRSAYEIRCRHWRQVIMECINSGMDKTAWCQSHGISRRCFYYWQKKFRDESIAPEDQTALPSVNCTNTGGDPDEAIDPAVFVDMTDKLSPSTNLRTTPALEGHTASFIPEPMINVNNHQIYVCGNITADTLETVMRVVSYA